MYNNYIILTILVYANIYLFNKKQVNNRREESKKYSISYKRHLVFVLYSARHHLMLELSELSAVFGK